MENQTPIQDPEQNALFSDPIPQRAPTHPAPIVLEKPALPPTPYEIVRPELNLEKHADLIFSPSHSKDLHEERSRSWERKLSNGTISTASLVIQTYKNKRPTVKTRKVYLGLNRLQELKGHNASGKTIISYRELANVLAIGWHGDKTVSEFTRELYQLRFTPFIMRGIFEMQRETIEPEDSFTILKSLRIVRRRDRQSSEFFDAKCEYAFHDYLQDHLEKNRRKPTLMVAARLRSEIASILYPRLDLFLSESEHYERRTEGLFSEDLRLTGKKYRYPSGRKQTLSKAVNEINGQPISTGMLNLRIEKTADGEDFKLVAWKTPYPEDIQPLLLELIATPKKLRLANPAADIPYIVQMIEQAIGPYPSKRRLFELFAKRYPLYPTINQAISEYRADRPENHHPLKYFQTILHRMTHKHGYMWIRPCAATCPLQSPVR